VAKSGNEQIGANFIEAGNFPDTTIIVAYQFQNTF